MAFINPSAAFIDFGPLLGHFQSNGSRFRSMMSVEQTDPHTIQTTQRPLIPQTPEQASIRGVELPVVTLDFPTITQFAVGEERPIS